MNKEVSSHIFSPKKGSYILIITNSDEATVRVGALGDIIFASGFYLYIGSALGPGGLNKRILRHLRYDKKIHWHIDYFLGLQTTNIVAIGELVNDKKMECAIIQAVKQLVTHGKIIPIKNFGSSDCQYESHLFYFKNQVLAEIEKIITTTNKAIKLIKL